METSPEAVTALAQAAHELHEAAREHKRSAAHHRRAARELMQRLAVLRRQCAALDVDLDLDPHIRTEE